jgi:hypothetical protein
MDGKKINKKVDLINPKDSVLKIIKPEPLKRNSRKNLFLKPRKEKVERVEETVAEVQNKVEVEKVEAVVETKTEEVKVEVVADVLNLEDRKEKDDLFKLNFLILIISYLKAIRN